MQNLANSSNEDCSLSIGAFPFHLLSMEDFAVHIYLIYCHVNLGLQLFCVKLLMSKLLSRATFHGKNNEKLGSTGNTWKNSQNTYLSIHSHKSSFGLFCACEWNDRLLAVFLFSSKGGYFLHRSIMCHVKCRCGRSIG